MQKRIKTLDEIAQEIHEPEIGTFKSLDRSNGYYITNFRTGRGFDLSDTKISLKLTFPGTNQPTSFGHFKSKRGYNSKLVNNKRYVNHYGEYIASIILKQLGKKACKVDLGITHVVNKYSNKEKEIEGCLSHYQLSNVDIMYPANVIIDDFKSLYPKKYRELTPRGRTDSDKNYTNIELLLEAFEYKFRKNGQESKIPEMRKTFFDMCAFDILYANRDRHDENFGLKYNQQTGEFSMYHLFDNEQILGMQEPLEAAQIYLQNEKEYEKFKESQLTSYIGFPGKTQKISSIELLEYLLEKYPSEILDSLKDIGRYKLSDLEELFGKLEKLAQPHKDLAKKIFIDRRREVMEVIKKHQEKSREKKLEIEDISL